MKKLYILVSLLFISSTIFIACDNCIDCDVPIYCDTNDDCKDSKLYDVACVGGKCDSNPCTDAFCGTGTCVLEDDPSTADFEEFAYCKCGEDSLPYKKAHSGTMTCTPKCEVHTDCGEAYINEGGQVAGACIKGQCNEINICTENSDCPEDNICGYEMCGPKPTGE